MRRALYRLLSRVPRVPRGASLRSQHCLVPIRSGAVTAIHTGLTLSTGRMAPHSAPSGVVAPSCDWRVGAR